MADQVNGDDSVPSTPSVHNDISGTIIGPAIQTGSLTQVNRVGRDQLDIVINGAGGGAMGLVEGADLDMWHHMVNVNLLGVLNVTHSAVPYRHRTGHNPAAPRSATLRPRRTGSSAATPSA